MINTMHGWWMPEEEGAEPNLFGVWKYQINQIVPGPQDSVGIRRRPVQDHPGEADQNHGRGGEECRKTVC